MSLQGISVVIPTFGRDEVLVRTVRALLALEQPAAEVLVMDQTPVHSAETEETLGALHDAGEIRWRRLPRPSITAAMNAGLREASCQLVLFLDDDIVPISELIAEHSRAHASDERLWASVGQVIQPSQQGAALESPRRLTGLREDYDFPFHSTLDADVNNVMAGNLCVNRQRALSIGGFDENFVGSAFRFETEFARRVAVAGGKIRFLGSAGIEHLRVASGGTRSQGSHLTSADPKHGLGDYYYAFLHGRPAEAWRYSARRAAREVMTKFHLTHPWWIPVKLFGELRAMLAARKLWRQGQKLVECGSHSNEKNDSRVKCRG